jgi:hypothetical protein
MFRKGGSADSAGTGITSGLAPRQGYAQPGTVKQNDSSRQRIMNAMGANPPKRNFYDFLTNFGLDIASRPSAGPGFGGLITTAAQSAKGPYETFSKARNADSNLMRQVGMESEIMDINKENAAAAAAAKDASAMDRLKLDIKSKADLYELERGDITQRLIDADAALLSDVDGGTYDTILPAQNHAEWKHKKSKDYDQSKIGGVLTKKQVTDAKTQAKFAKNQGKKNGVGKIYYDPFSDQVLEVVYDSVEREYSLRPVGGVEEVVDTTKVVVEDKVSSNPSYNRPRKPDVISPYIKGFADSVTEEEGEFGTGS